MDLFQRKPEDRLDSEQPRDEKKETVIGIVDDNQRFLNAAVRALNASGYPCIHTASDVEGALVLVTQYSPDLMLLDLHLQGDSQDGLELLVQLRAGGYNKLAVLITVDRSMPQFFRAARAGANDFLVKSPHLSLGDEVSHILARHRTRSDSVWNSQAISELSYLRSFGLTPGEIRILKEYAKDFPRYKELADRVGKAERQVRKTFSRICKKLDVGNLAQLAHILTVCAVFDEKE